MYIIQRNLNLITTKLYMRWKFNTVRQKWFLLKLFFTLNNVKWLLIKLINSNEANANWKTQNSWSQILWYTQVCRLIAGADKSHCPTPGASAFSDRASETSLGTCPWASDITSSCIESESSFLYKLTNLILLLVMKTL